jgi:hypothetical protein
MVKGGINFIFDVISLPKPLKKSHHAAYPILLAFNQSNFKWPVTLSTRDFGAGPMPSTVALPTAI